MFLDNYFVLSTVQLRITKTFSIKSFFFLLASRTVFISHDTDLPEETKCLICRMSLNFGIASSLIDRLQAFSRILSCVPFCAPQSTRSQSITRSDVSFSHLVKAIFLLRRKVSSTSVSNPWILRNHRNILNHFLRWL